MIKKIKRQHELNLITLLGLVDSAVLFLWVIGIYNFIFKFFSSLTSLCLILVILPLPLPHIPLCFRTLPVFMLLFILSCSLCIIKADHLPLEELHATWLSCLPATQECWGQEEPAVWVSVSDQTMLYLYISFFSHYTLILSYCVIVMSLSNLLICQIDDDKTNWWWHWTDQMYY